MRIYRVAVTSSDGKKCSVNIRVDDQKFYPSNLKQIADALRVEREHIELVLDTWTPDVLKKHLESYPEEVLKDERARLFTNHPHCGVFGKS